VFFVVLNAPNPISLSMATSSSSSSSTAPLPIDTSRVVEEPLVLARGPAVGAAPFVLAGRAAPRSRDLFLSRVPLSRSTLGPRGGDRCLADPLSRRGDGDRASDVSTVCLVSPLPLETQSARDIRRLLLGSSLSRSPSSLVFLFRSRSRDLERERWRRSVGLSWSFLSCRDDRVVLCEGGARSTEGSAIMENVSSQTMNVTCTKF